MTSGSLRRFPGADACIEQSFAMFDDDRLNPNGYVLGGSEGILTTADAARANPLYTEPPTAYLYYLASFAQAIHRLDLPGPESG